MKKKLLYFCSMVLAAIMIFPASSNAYQLNNQNVGYSPTYTNLSSAIPYVGSMDYATQWNYSGGSIFLSKHSGSGRINIYQGFVDTDNGKYGTCFYNSTSESDIRYYRLFKNADSITRAETVVHEVGHAIGLHHTQSKNDSISVMREYGFNNKAYPLSDDKAGLKAKY